MFAVVDDEDLSPLHAQQLEDGRLPESTESYLHTMVSVKCFACVYGVSFIRCPWCTTKIFQVLAPAGGGLPNGILGKSHVFGQFSILCDISKFVATINDMSRG